MKDWASWILPDDTTLDLEELLLGDTMVDPVGFRLNHRDHDSPLTEQEVDIVKDHLLMYLRYAAVPYCCNCPICQAACQACTL